MALCGPTLGISIFLLVPSGLLATPQTPAESAAKPTSQTPQVIRSTTRLVQLSVVVQDKKGNPVTGLKKSDFTVLDEGSRQELAFFSAPPSFSETSPQAAPANLLPANAFTNRYDLKGQDPGAVTIVLFDALNTFPEDQGNVRKRVLRFLQSLKPQDHVAIYALTTQLLVLHEFTQDTSALVNAVARFTPEELAAFDASHEVRYHVSALANDAMWARFEDALNNISGKISDQNTINRIGTTVGAFKAIGDHVAGIPGHKSLIWVSGGFPIQVGTPTIGKPGEADQYQTNRTNQLTPPDRFLGSFGEDVAAAAFALNRANIAVYTVDAHGLTPMTGLDPSLINGDLLGPGQVSHALNAEQDARASSRLLADRTGGLAFFGTNDIGDALHHAFDDGRYAYNLDFYPAHGKWDGKFHKIKIQALGADLRLRYRAGYYATPNRSDPEELVKTELRQAANSPLDATSLGMIVSGNAVQPLSARKLELHMGIDPKQLLLKDSETSRKGAVDLFFLQRDGSGKILSAEQQHIIVNLEEKQYEYVAQAAMVFDRHLIVAPEATEIRVVVRDSGSGALGSVTIPVRAFFPTEANP
jgi:VWFA-related protein